MRYLITGGAGFIGSHLVDALTVRGEDVLVLDDLSTGRLDNLDGLDHELNGDGDRSTATAIRSGDQLPAKRPPSRRFAMPHGNRPGSVEFVAGSVTDEALVDDCMSSVDVCFHLASAVGVQLVVSQPLQSLLRNIRGCDIVISAAAAGTAVGSCSPPPRRCTAR